MRIIGLLLLLSVAAALSGCTNRYQHQVEQTLLLQENQRLEDALYVTHTQLVDLKRENESLRTRIGEEPSVSRSEAVSPVRPRRIGSATNADSEEAPIFLPSEVEIPSDAKERTTLPDALKSSQKIPMPQPPRQMKVSQTGQPSRERETFPELTLPETGFGETATPAWTPTR